MTTTLTPITINELSQLQALSIETYTNTFGAANTPEILQAYLDEAYNTKQLTVELTDPDSTFYFLIQDGQLAGYLKLNVNDGQSEAMGPDYLEVERIYLKPSFQHLGLGKTMITFAEKQAIQAHKSKVWLGVWEHNENAKAFYHRLGFEKVGAHTFYMGDDPQTDFMMSKALTED